MKPGDEMEAFLRDGYERYVGAKDAVDTFEQQIQERLMRQFEDKLDWSNFEARRGERGRAKAVHFGVWENVGRPAIWACNYDQNGNSVELGIRWGTHETGRPFLYTTRWEPRFRKVYLADAKPPVQNREGHLIVVVGDDFDMEPMAAVLLGEMDRALGITRTTT